jgi:hypothetical protein
VTWLPFNHKGARTPDEARRDLLTVLRADRPLNHAHVAVGRAGDEPQSLTGYVSGLEHPDGSVEVSVDGQPLFELGVGDLIGGELQTLDGADYYTLILKFGWGEAVLRDAYNGLG